MKDKQCPCIECICKAVCRHKGFIQLTHDCILASNYHTEHTDKEFFHAISVLQDTLKPTNWSYKKSNAL